MVDRIQKTGREEYWKVSASGEAKKDKKHQGKHSDEQGGKQKRDRFGDSSDFIQMLAKDPKKYRSQKISVSQIKDFTFRGVSTDREKAVLEVDISLTDGGLVQGAQIALSRQEGMQYLGRKLGEKMMTGQVVTDPVLSVALPQKTDSETGRKTTWDAAKEAAVVAEKKNSWYFYLILAIALLAMVWLMYIFLVG